MAQGTKVTLQGVPQGVQTQPQAFFKKNDFDVTIWQHGYDVIVEKALRCPCKSKGADNLASCKNCGGSGWFFINPKQTKAIMHSMNLQTNFREWSEVNVGTVNVSVRDIDKLAFMDRITVLQGNSIHSQTVFTSFYKGVLFAFLDYTPKDVEEVYLFVSGDDKLVLLQENVDYTIVDYKILIDKKYHHLKDVTLTIRYNHAPQFHVIDLPRDVMVSTIRTTDNRKIKAQMPVNAVGRRAHYVINRQSFNGDLYFDNSYEENKCCTDKKETNCNP